MSDTSHGQLSVGSPDAATAPQGPSGTLRLVYLMPQRRLYAPGEAGRHQRLCDAGFQPARMRVQISAGRDAGPLHG